MCPPPPHTHSREYGHLQGRGQIKYRQKREIEASPVGGFPHYDRRKAPIFRPPGAPPLAHWPPLALFRSHRLGISVAAAWLPEAAPGRARAAGERAAAGAGGGLGPFGESRALSSIVNKEREISPSADASADTQSYWGGGGKGERKCHFFPRENTSEVFMSSAKGEFWGGRRGREGD